MSTLVFFIGTGRCGSTLTYEVLCKHPGIGFISNLDDRRASHNPKGRRNNLLYRCLPVSEGVRKHVAPSEAYRLLDHLVSPILSQSGRDIVADDATVRDARRLQGFFEERIAAQGRPTFAHKFTGWPRALFLHKVFPDAKFVHVVRDGRAVANSMLQMPWWGGYGGPAGWRYGPLPDRYHSEWISSKKSNVVLAGITWKLLIDQFKLAQDALPSSSWLQIRYEDIVATPRPKFEQLLTFSGLGWDRRFERSLNRQRFSTGPTSAFKRDLSQSQREMLTESLADHLNGLGYQLDAEPTAAESPHLTDGQPS